MAKINLLLSSLCICAIALVSSCPFSRRKEHAADAPCESDNVWEEASATFSPDSVMSCDGTKAVTTTSMTQADYSEISESVAAMWRSFPAVW